MLTVEHTDLVIPTYERGPDDPFPPVTFGGSPGLPRRRPYPYPLQDDVDIASMALVRDRRYGAVRLSNGLLEVLVLPEMNGRVYSIRDLRSGRELLYRNHVVKPALVALRGAWISGGIEFNLPTLGHSVSTVSPVFHAVSRNEDRVAVTVGDIDRSTRQRWQVCLSLRPNRCALDITTTLSNPNHHRERLYYWENAAIPARDDLRFVCRCDWVVATRDTPFPLQEGTDRSLHVNNPRPCDHFGYRSYRDFFGGFYGGERVGTYHVGPRYEAPGQKYFTWGMETDSRIWLNYLTDDDGQYVEIQSGHLESQWFTGWQQAHESVVVHGAWFGTADAGELTWANTHVGVAVDAEADATVVDIVPIDLVGPHRLVVRSAGDEQVFTVDCRPGVTSHVDVGRAARFELELRGAQGRLLLAEAWHGVGSDGLDPERPRQAPHQWALRARSEKPRGAIETALQFHRWAIARSELDAGQGGLPEGQRRQLEAELRLKTDRTEEASRQAQHGLDLSPGDPSLHVLAAASALRRQRQSGEGALVHAVLDHCLAARSDTRLADAGLCMLAEAWACRQRPLDALQALESLAARRQTCDPVAAAMLIALNRRCGDSVRARQLLDQRDSCLWPEVAMEEWLLRRRTSGHSSFHDASGVALTLPGDGSADGALAVHQAELVLEALMLYWRCRWFDDLADLMPAAAAACPPLVRHPLFHLLRMDLAGEAGDEVRAGGHARAAAALPVWFVAPSRWEDAELLGRGIRLAGDAAGCLPYLLALSLIESGQVLEGVRLLKQVVRDRSRPDVRRLAAKALADWSAYVKRDSRAAERHLRVAHGAGPTDRRIVLALDQLLFERHAVAGRERLWRGTPPEWRARGDVTFRLARLAFDAGRPEEAVDLLRSRTFTVYEGGTSVRRLYVDALLVSAMESLAGVEAGAAIAAAGAVLEFPENLGAASYLGEHSRLARFLLGLAASRAGERDEACRWWRDVVSRGGPSTTYTIGGEAARRIGRVDERLALDLASAGLAGEGEAVAGTRPLVRRCRSGQGPEQASASLAWSIRTGSRQAERRAEQMLRQWPCSSVLRILHALARLRCPGM